MQDPLDALRRAYGEPDAPPERLDAEVQAEVDMLAPLKAGLDALPPQLVDTALPLGLHVTQIDPILILDSAPDGILANHRANMAAPISHARFFVGLLIETLST